MSYLYECAACGHQLMDCIDSAANGLSLVMECQRCKRCQELPPFYVPMAITPTFVGRMRPKMIVLKTARRRGDPPPCSRT